MREFLKRFQSLFFFLENNMLGDFGCYREALTELTVLVGVVHLRLLRFELYEADENSATSATPN
jgi:hypothetical protein